MILSPQLQMGSPIDCLETVKKCILQIQCKGTLLAIMLLSLVHVYHVSSTYTV